MVPQINWIFSWKFWAGSHLISSHFFPPLPFNFPLLLIKKQWLITTDQIRAHSGFLSIFCTPSPPPSICSALDLCEFAVWPKHSLMSSRSSLRDRPYLGSTSHWHHTPFFCPSVSILLFCLCHQSQCIANQSNTIHECAIYLIACLSLIISPALLEF